MGRLSAIQGGARRAALKNGAELHLISAYELMQARYEAGRMADGDAETAGLALNACILARAARRDGKRLFESGEAVLRAMPAEQIGFWTRRYLALCAEENPSCCTEGHEQIMDELREDAYERLKWRVLRAFGVLPSEARAREMTDGEYLYCVLQMTLDRRSGWSGCARRAGRRRKRAAAPYAARRSASGIPILTRRGLRS